MTTPEPEWTDIASGLEPVWPTDDLLRDFALGEVVFLRHHPQPCEVLEFGGPGDSFSFPLVLIGLVGGGVHGWVEPCDLARIPSLAESGENGRLSSR